MQQQQDSLVIKVGGSPLELPEFIALKMEINKLNHPARPEVSWSLISSLSLTLFKTNGIDLQTAVYYTLARLERDGLAGFTEGCELMANVIVSHWDELWPPQPNYRTDILDWFNSKASTILRKNGFKQQDLRLIYRVERALQLIINKLAQTTWSKLPKVENLLWFFQNSAKQLEQHSPEPTLKNPSVNLPPLVYLSSSQSNNSSSAPLTPAQETLINVRQMPVEKSRMSGFVGFLLGLTISIVAIVIMISTLYLPLKKELAALTEQPQGAVAQWLYLPQLASYSANLNIIEKQSPLAPFVMADNMVNTAQRKWPNDPDQAYTTRQWQNVFQTRLEDAPINNSWSQTTERLQKLADKIVTQERNRGSFTLSYLKTEIYNIQQSHNKSIPLEERLRELAADIAQGTPLTQSQLNRIDIQINGLLAQYYNLQKQAESVGLKPQSY